MSKFVSEFGTQATRRMWHGQGKAPPGDFLELLYEPKLMPAPYPSMTPTLASDFAPDRAAAAKDDKLMVVVKTKEEDSFAAMGRLLAEKLQLLPPPRKPLCSITIKQPELAPAKPPRTLFTKSLARRVSKEANDLHHLTDNPNRKGLILLEVVKKSRKTGDYRADMLEMLRVITE